MTQGSISMATGLRKLADFLWLAELSPSDFLNRMGYPVLVIAWAKEDKQGSERTGTGSENAALTKDVTRGDSLIISFEPPAGKGGGPLKIGRGTVADVVLPFETVSRVHAELRQEGATAYVTDKGSKNG